MKKILIGLTVLVALVFGQEKASALPQGAGSVSLQKLGGSSSITLSQYSGKVILLDFWASWCLPCRISFPLYQRLQNTYGGQGFVVIAVNEDDDPKAAQKFYSDLGVSFLAVEDTKKELASIFNPGEMPTSFLIDRQGNIIYTHEGFRSGDDERLEAKVKEVLGK